MSMYSLSVLRVNIAECDSVAGIVPSEEKPRKAANQNRDYRNTKIKEKHGGNVNLFGVVDDML